MSITNDKKAYSAWLASLALNRPLSLRDHEIASGFCANLPIYYSESKKDQDPQFMVLMTSSYHAPKPYRALHILSSTIGKWVPLTKEKIFKSQPPSKKKKVLAALRLLVKPQIDDFRSLIILPMICPLTNKILDDFENCHVDHYRISFISIVESWLLANGYTFETLSLNRASKIKSQNLAQDFYAYHKKVCDLRLVDKKANMTKGRKTLQEYKASEKQKASKPKTTKTTKTKTSKKA